MQAFSNRVIGSLWVLSDADRQTTDRQRDARRAAGVDERHRFQDQASGARDDRPGLAQALTFLQPGDGRMGWKRDWLGRSLPHRIESANGLKTAGVGLRALTEPMDTATPHGELLFYLFGALAQYERALTQERIRAGLAAARRRGRRGGRPRVRDVERLEAVRAALGRGESTAAVCRTFGIPRSTLYEALRRGS